MLTTKYYLCYYISVGTTQGKDDFMLSADFINIYRYNNKVYSICTMCGLWLMYNDKAIAYKPTPQQEGRCTIDTQYWSNRHKVKCENELSDFLNCRDIIEVQYRIQTHKFYLGIL